VPGINKVFSLIIQQERKYNNSGTLSVENKVLLNTAEKTNYKAQEQGSWKGQGRGNNFRGQGRGRGRNPNQGKQCTYDHKMNHTAEECYSKHGYSPWYKQRGDQERSYYSDKSGNTQQTCNLKVKGDAQDSTNQTSTKEANTSTSLSTEQIQKLLRLLEDKGESNHAVSHIQSSSNNISIHKDQQGKVWILDTGATDHVTHDLNQFSTFYKIKLVTVRLPNNFTVIVEYAGTKYFNNDFIIYNVLYIPDFSFNLIYVQSLIKDLNYRLIFSNEHCQIQHNTSYKTIGRASMLKGLYHLDNCPSISEDYLPLNTTLNCSKNSVNIWHHRLGHPCDSVMKQICKVFPYVNDSCKDICDICHYSKQHKLPFQDSTTSSLNCFDMIHTDIWGPIFVPSIHGHRYFLTVVDDCSSHTWIFHMHSKSETRKLLLNFVIYVKNQFEKNIKIIRSDNGPEFEYIDLYNRYALSIKKVVLEL